MAGAVGSVIFDEVDRIAPAQPTKPKASTANKGVPAIRVRSVVMKSRVLSLWVVGGGDGLALKDDRPKQFRLNQRSQHLSSGLDLVACSQPARLRRAGI